MDNQRIIEDNKISIEIKRKFLKANWVMVLLSVLMLIFAILVTIFGFLENNLAYIIVGICILFVCIIGQFYSSRTLGKLRCEIDYLKNQIEEIEKEQSHPQNWTRIR